MAEEMIRLQNLKKYYGKTRGIENVSLTINKGEIYGFIGPNGAGKSTTIRTIMGLISKTGGKVYIKGKEADPNDPELKRIIGYLPGELNLYGEMTVKQLFCYHQSFYEKDFGERLLYLTEALKIDESKKIEDLSLGNLKKVGIVLALMHEPEILILDEPTSGLDPIMQNTFHDILLKEKERGVTILYSSHILSEVSNLCERIGFIKDGTIINEDYIEKIKKENYSYLKIVSNDIKRIKNGLGLKVYKEDQNGIVFINDLEPNSLVQKLAEYDIKQLFIEEIPLEDLFLNYYK
ncbi:MAG: ABC transporter ATP-binding protein [Clostridia bacterium]|nr:ABC transporter ATP-binding protein [Clostridia bacterium]